MSTGDIKNIISDISTKKRTGVLRVYRKMFGDPLLFVSFLKGVPVYAYSFLVKDKWYDGLLTSREVEDNLFGNLFEYAFSKYGEKYVEHMVKYSNDVIYNALSEAITNNWQLSSEFEDLDEDTIRQSIGIVRVKTKIEALAKTLQSLGARDIYIPSIGKFMGFSRVEDLKVIYDIVNRNFDESDAVISTPFANVFLIHKEGKPMVFSTDGVLSEEDFERIMSIVEEGDSRKFKGSLKKGMEIKFPVLNTYGKPFLISLRKDDGFIVAHIKEDRVLMVEEKVAKRLFRTIMEYNEKLSLLLYNVLEKKTQIKSQDIIDIRIRILLMKHPHPDEFRKAIEKEKF